MATYIKKYDNLPINSGEILRYSGVKNADGKMLALIDDCVKEAADIFRFDVCYGEFEMVDNGSSFDLGFTKISSKSVKKHLCGCEKIVVFAATVGIEIDRLIARYGKISPAKSLIFQAIGAERIEALCDAFCRDIAEEYSSKGCFTRPRFSPGYGDLPLEIQTDIFKALDCSKKIGLTLNSSLLMSPSKSVTAIIGVSKSTGNHDSKNCTVCQKTDCIFRRNV